MGTFHLGGGGFSVVLVDQMDDRRLRCGQQLSRLRALTQRQESGPISLQCAAELQDATNAILGEVEEMGRTMLDHDGRLAPAAETFMWVRVARLATTADQAVDAARRGDTAGLRAHLRHFETLTSALWTVWDAM
jgi:hypothetical protein